MPDETQPGRKRLRKKEKFVQDSLPETGVPPVEAPKPGSRKRGFYSRFFTHLELTDLDVINQEKLFDEIELLRVAMRRCFEAASTIESNDYEGWGMALSSLGAASTRLAGMLRTQQLLNNNGDDAYLKILSSALTQVCKEMKI